MSNVPTPTSKTFIISSEDMRNDFPDGLERFGQAKHKVWSWTRMCCPGFKKMAILVVYILKEPVQTSK
jgi:hypothetical protein